MEKFNQWEEKQSKTAKENLLQFSALMDFGYQFFSKQQIERFRKEKLKSLIMINRKLKETSEIKFSKFPNFRSLKQEKKEVKKC